MATEGGILIKQTTNRVAIIQGGQFTFDMGLFVDGVLRDPDEYPVTPATEPVVNILDPSGATVEVGVGVRTAEGEYTYLYTVPLNAEVSENWTIKWGATIDGVYYYWAEYFKVIDKSATQPKYFDPNQLSSGKTEEYILAIKGRTERVYLETKVGSDIVYPVAIPSYYLYDQSETLITSGTATEVSSGTYYCEILSTTLDTSDKQWMLVWNYQLTATEPTRTVIQTVWTCPISIFGAVIDVRMILDKALKPTDRIMGYSDQEIVRYLKNGLRMFNMRTPATVMTFNNLDDNAYAWIIQLAVCWGLKAQILAEIDMSYTLAGQTISLTWEHQNALQTMYNTLWGEWDKLGREAKLLYLGKGRLLYRPQIAGYIGAMNRSVSAGTFFEALKI